MNKISDEDTAASWMGNNRSIGYAQKMDDRRYPDNSEIFARKAEGRRALAKLSFGEKLAMLDRLRERVQPIVRAREARKQELAARVAKGDPIR